MIGVGMLMIQVLLGGITRLTGSGLSITEWDVVTGTLPPLNQQQWMTEFHKYQLTPQYRLLNTDFTLGDFKFIFFWEYTHRLWARIIGIVFLVPFVIFIATKRIRQDMIIPLVVLVMLGAMQGLVGWIMVASGLTGDAIYVNPVKLTLHFLFAMGLIAYTFWFGLQLLVREQRRRKDEGLIKWCIALLTLVAIQLAFGALMAGNKAASAAPTWPSINGAAWPAGLWSETPGIRNLFDNKITIQFIHRGLAYLIFCAIAAFTWKAYMKGLRSAWIPMALVCLQVMLGIYTVLTSDYPRTGPWGTFQWIAQAHQLVGMFLFLSLLYVYYLVHGRRPTRI